MMLRSPHSRGVNALEGSLWGIEIHRTLLNNLHDVDGVLLIVERNEYGAAILGPCAKHIEGFEAVPECANESTIRHGQDRSLDDLTPLIFADHLTEEGRACLGRTLNLVSRGRRRGHPARGQRVCQIEKKACQE